MGGPGSGHWGHKGRKGRRGGSAPSKAGTVAKSPYLNSVLEGRVDTYVPPSSRTDPIANEIIKEQGFDGKPDVVTASELNEFVNSGERELYRGVSRGEYAEELMYGDSFETGTGMHGAGLYTVYGENADSTAMYFGAKQGENATIIRMSLKKDANVISESALKEEMEGWLASRESVKVDPDTLRTQAFAAANRGDNKTANNLMQASYIAEQHGDVVGHIATGDRGRFAAASGYDAIDVSEQGYMVVLNRSALRIAENPMSATAPKRGSIKSPRVLPSQQVDVSKIVPSAVLPKHRVSWLRNQIESKRQQAIAAAEKVATSKSPGTVKKWHTRRKYLEQDMHHLIAVLEGRVE